MTRWNLSVWLFAVVPLFLSCVAETYERSTEEHGDRERRVLPGEMGSDWRRDGPWLVSPAIETSEGVGRVGVLVVLRDAAPMPSIQARLGAVADEPWVDLASTWSEEDHHVGVAEFDALGTLAELRIEAVAREQVLHLRWNASLPTHESEALEIGVESVRSPLAAELQGLGIVARSEWGARATRCGGRDGSKSRMAIHHTVTGSSDPERQLRGIQRYHMDSRGWCDVGYHFLIGSNGTVYEGRPFPFIGAHVGRNNTANIGIAFIGCFHSSGCAGFGATSPPQKMVEAAGRLVGELSRRYGIEISASTVKGHRDHAGQTTSCPGDDLHRRLGDIRTLASDGTSTPPGLPANSCKHTYGGTYGDHACSEGYQCCDGRWGGRGRCGACSCVEPTGLLGCRAPPPGASCVHTYGGRYANTACSPGYQCCDGRWRPRGACGTCYCEEATGSRGCGI